MDQLDAAARSIDAALDTHQRENNLSGDCARRMDEIRANSLGVLLSRQSGIHFLLWLGAGPMAPTCYPLKPARWPFMQFRFGQHWVPNVGTKFGSTSFFPRPLL
uniref:Uncharacterized protein n=1 Tax=Bionectria ochroleuca TaxID=29856 RepID=A0A0B7JL08_BIOOC